ncbi:MAG TPA: alcohol dehydrogenase catalytic domain-containing protein [Pseudonocardiaceae bacterium]|nr:alcohol dehydrogenase catalytic domain-containing protein [Pseudonocardiaceae bacterium]
MSATMRAAVYHGAKDVRIEERPVPTAGAGQVLVRVTRSGICGTDATEYLHGPGMFPVHRKHAASGHIGPMVMGHEFVGEVVDHGPGADHLAGQRIATGAGVSCGACGWCRSGRTNLCARYWTLGLNADGGLAGYAAVPAATCVPIPDDCVDDAAGLAQPLAVGLHAVRRARVAPDETVVVIGAGAIGSFILCGLARRRPARVIALDVADDRLRTATALGATETHNVADRDPVPLVRELTGGEGAPLVIESSGAPGSAQRAVRMAARGGRVLLVGLAHEPQSLDLADATLREVDLLSTVAHVCGDDIPAALALLAGGDIATHLLDRVIGLDALVPDGLDALVERRAAGKILVDPWR